MSASTRVCLVCEASLEGRRADARYCSGACRAEGSRLQQILRGEGSGPYRTVASRLQALTERTKKALGIQPEDSALENPQPNKEK
jgi:hypothetical protein